jgi:monoamine oxidase
MGKTRLFDRLARARRIAGFCEQRGLDTRTGAADYAAEEHARGLTRRTLLGALGLAAGAAALAPLRARAKAGPRTRVAIVGAGLAGLACADALAKAGIAATLYEAHPSRVGGRCFSNRDTFPGQVAENGGELIDTPHKTMLGFARELGLAVENLERDPGAPTYHFFGQHHTEDEVVDEYRELVARMRPDLRACSGKPSALYHTPADVALDNTDLQTYLDTRGAGLPLIRAVLAEAYIAEYGLEPSRQSCLNLLLFIHLDRRRHFAEFGVFSDERYHVAGGNDAIAHGLADRLPGAIHTNARLTRLGRNAAGEYELYLNGGSTPERADAVVVTVPFSVLRTVQLDPSLGLSAGKLRAIAELGYGTNAKTMIGFDRRVWTEQGRNGLAYSDLPHVQNTWETNWSRSPGSGVLTDYSGGDRGYALQLNPQGTSNCGGCHDGAPTHGVLNPNGHAWIDGQGEDFVRDLDRIWPGVAAAASRRADGSLVLQRGHWYPQPYSRGSYTCYLPGQFTAIAGYEGESAGGLKFAGEHTDSFYDWQGFMEGACNSGIAAAKDILRDIKDGRLPA